MGTVTKTIGTSSRDYSTLQAWEDALPANLVTDGNAQVGECYNDSEFTAKLTISGQTTNSTNNITLRCASGQSFKDHADKLTNRLAYNASNGVAIRTTTDYATGVVVVGSSNVTLEGLQVKATGWQTAAITNTGSTSNFVVSKCICSAVSGNNANDYVVSIYGASSNKIINSLVIADSSNANSGIHLGSGANAINCTLVRPSNRTAGGKAFTSVYGSSIVRNCAIFGFTNSSTGTYNSDGHNVTDHTSAPGSTGNITSATYANQFVQSSTGSSVEDFRIVGTGSDLDDAGVTDTTNIPAGDDIVGQTRSTWDVGCWEYVAGGSTITATTSLSAAIQIARSATAGMNVAVQAGSSATAVVNAAVQQARTASVSLAAAVQEARSTTTSLNAAVQAATSTGASVNTAVQAPASASASLNTAVQQARSATPSVDAAVQAQGTAAASVNAAVQAGQGASSAVDVAIQQARAATASINTAVQASQTAAASIDAAVQAVGSATVGLNTYVQSDGAIGVSLNAAIQAQQQASAGLNLAVQLARSAGTALDVVVALAQTASVSLNAYIQAPSEVTTALNAAIQHARSATVSLNAAVQVQRSAQISLSAALAVGQLLTAAVDVAVRAARSRSTSLSAYIFDDSAPIPQRDFMRDISSYAAAPAPIRATLLGTSIRIHPR